MLARIRATATAGLAIAMAMSVLGGLPARARAAAGDPYFTEYVEGPTGTFAKALEIYNPGDAPIHLGAAGYAVEVYANGGTTPASISLTGTLAAHDVFVLANPTSAADVLAVADQVSATANFNGNDAIVLRNAAAGVVDTIGQFAFDPGAAGWGTPPTSTLDAVLRRLTTVTTGDSNPFDVYDPAVEWDSAASTDFTDLGSYGPGGGGTGSDGATVDADVTMAASAACLELSDTSISFGTLGFGAEDQPATPSVTLTNCATVAETLLAGATDAVGSTAAWSLVDSSATCADSLGIESFRLNLHSQELPVPVSLESSSKSVQTLAAGASTTHTAHIYTPCPGSSGDGQTVTFQINYLATE